MKNIICWLYGEIKLSIIITKMRPILLEKIYCMGNGKIP